MQTGRKQETHFASVSTELTDISASSKSTSELQSFLRNAVAARERSKQDIGLAIDARRGVHN